MYVFVKLVDCRACLFENQGHLSMPYCDLYERDSSKCLSCFVNLQMYGALLKNPKALVEQYTFAEVVAICSFGTLCMSPTCWSALSLKRNLA